MSAQDQLSGAPPFVAKGVRFRCWITDDGQRYEWRDDSGSRRVGRNTGASTCWAARDGKRVGAHYSTLRDAMEAVV